MKPYYEHAGITIFLGDCREILPSLSGTVVTDPPYNIGYEYGDSYKDDLSEDEYRELIAQSTRLPSVVIHYPEDMFGVASALGELPEECVAWTYNAHTPRKWRLIAWFGNKPDFSLVRQPYKNLSDKRIVAKLDAGSEGCALYDWWHEEQVKNISEEKTEHPCQIPLEVHDKDSASYAMRPGCRSVRWFRHNPPRSQDLGRKAIGIEIEEKYCEIAANRLRQEVLDFQP